MTLEQALVQLGIGGAVLAVVFALAVLAINKIAVPLIAKWSAAEQARTDALTVGLGNIAAAVSQHAVADMQSHAELGADIARIEGTLNTLVVGRAPASADGLRVVKTPPALVIRSNNQEDK